MKKIILHLFTLSFAGVIIFISCKKEKSCEGCIDGNKPPIAVAGPDQSITLPTDSISLDGSSSSDPDGTISNWLWTKISGPASFNIVNSANAKTVVKNLAVGSYQFELKVTDDKGLSAKDTIQVMVNSVTPTNRPPVANAGVDQTITLPTNTIILNGSASTDPDNNINSYLWTKISGPSSFNITNPNIVQTQVTNLVEGVYQFELKVADAGGLFSKDTMQVNVNAQPPPNISCPPTSRPIINAQLMPIGNLSIGRSATAVVSAGNKILFAGGANSGLPSSRVDIYDVSAQTWSTAELSIPRYEISTVACANKVFFAGGTTASGWSSRVDIYDVSTQAWSTAELSEPRTFIVAATTGNKVFFAGGCSNYPFYWSAVTNKIDIYDLSTNTWSVKILSETKIGFTATMAGSKIYFAGGWNLNPNVSNSTSANIDIYDDATGTWSTSTLNVAKGFHVGIFKNGKMYWAGGMTYIDEPWFGGNVYTCQVEIRDLNTGSSEAEYLFNPAYWEINYGQNAVVKDNKIIFFRHDGGVNANKFDIYDTNVNTWSIGILPDPIPVGSSVICVNNIIYVAGGIVNGVLSNQVRKLEF